MSADQNENAANLNAILETVIHRRADGEDLPDSEILKAHPGVSGLETALNALRQVESARQDAERQVIVRCPHCKAAIDTHADDVMSDVVCEACGSSFSLCDSGATATHFAATQKRIAHFELTERLGSGAFGSVWKARDTKLGRTIAVKVPHEHRMNAEYRERFLREARAAGNLQHDGIVGVHEVGTEGELVYIATEFIRG
ncbi:MAG: protein kinase, partial [Planctomycetota bacterium]